MALAFRLALRQERETHFQEENNNKANIFPILFIGEKWLMGSSILFPFSCQARASVCDILPILCRITPFLPLQIHTDQNLTAAFTRISAEYRIV